MTARHVIELQNVVQGPTRSRITNIRPPLGLEFSAEHFDEKKSARSAWVKL